MADAGFTVDDLKNIGDAIREITAGKRVVQVTLQDRVKRYSDVQLPDLQKLRDMIRNEINAGTSVTTKRPRLFRMRYQKGLLGLAHKLPLKKSRPGLATNPTAVEEIHVAHGFQFTVRNQLPRHGFRPAAAALAAGAAWTRRVDALME